MSLFVKEISNINELVNLNFKLKRKSNINKIFENDNASTLLYEQSKAMHEFIESLSIAYQNLK